MDSSQDSVLELDGAKHDVWLVKVPKYLANKWLAAPDDSPVGKLRISKNAGRTEVTYSMDKSLEAVGGSSSKSFATEHRFILQGAEKNGLSVFSTSASAKAGEKRAMEGRVVQKVDCRPIVTHNYMQLKRTQMIEASKPKRVTKQLEAAVKTVYKPISLHKEERDYELQKKKEGKKERMDKEQLESVLFEAFEKHQYYNIKDLKEITQQPLVYLKEILNQIGMYNKHPGHRYMWELKPEYRLHKTQPKSSDDTD